jgi:hypothetical protein
MLSTAIVAVIRIGRANTGRVPERSEATRVTPSIPGNKRWKTYSRFVRYMGT